MAFRDTIAAVTYPYQPAAPPLTPLPGPPPALPPGHGLLVVSFNRGPYMVPVMTTSRFKIDGRDVRVQEGTWFIVVPAGQRQIKVTDFIGVTIASTILAVQPGATHQLRWDFGAWRNRVYDHRNADVTKFGMWSNYTVMLITLGIILPVTCCAILGILGAVL